MLSVARKKGAIILPRIRGLVVLLISAVLCLLLFSSVFFLYLVNLDTDAQLERFLAASLPSSSSSFRHSPVTTLVVYAYSCSPENKANAEFFLQRAMKDPTISVLFVVSSSSSSRQLPYNVNHERVFVLYRENYGFDFCAHREVFARILGSSRSRLLFLSRFRHLILINASVRGPFLPEYMQVEKWSTYLTRMLSDKSVDILGTTANCMLPEVDESSRSPLHFPGFHLQSMLLVLPADVFVDRVYPRLACYEMKHSVIELIEKKLHTWVAERTGKSLKFALTELRFKNIDRHRSSAERDKNSSSIFWSDATRMDQLPNLHDKRIVADDLLTTACRSHSLRANGNILFDGNGPDGIDSNPVELMFIKDGQDRHRTMFSEEVINAYTRWASSASVSNEKKTIDESIRRSSKIEENRRMDRVGQGNDTGNRIVLVYSLMREEDTENLRFLLEHGNLERGQATVHLIIIIDSKDVDGRALREIESSLKILKRKHQHSMNENDREEHQSETLSPEDATKLEALRKAGAFLGAILDKKSAALKSNLDSFDAQDVHEVVRELSSYISKQSSSTDGENDASSSPFCPPDSDHENRDCRLMIELRVSPSKCASNRICSWKYAYDRINHIHDISHHDGSFLKQGEKIVAFLDSSAIGPFLPTYIPSNHHWLDVLTASMKEKRYALVVASMKCDTASDNIVVDSPYVVCKSSICSQFLDGAIKDHHNRIGGDLEMLPDVLQQVQNAHHRESVRLSWILHKNGWDSEGRLGLLDPAWMYVLNSLEEEETNHRGMTTEARMCSSFRRSVQLKMHKSDSTGSNIMSDDVHDSRSVDAHSPSGSNVGDHNHAPTVHHRENKGDDKHASTAHHRENKGNDKHASTAHHRENKGDDKHASTAHQRKSKGDVNKENKSDRNQDMSDDSANNDEHSQVLPKDGAKGDASENDVSGRFNKIVEEEDSISDGKGVDIQIEVDKSPSAGGEISFSIERVRRSHVALIHPLDTIFVDMSEYRNLHRGNHMNHHLPIDDGRGSSTTSSDDDNRWNIDAGMIFADWERQASHKGQIMDHHRAKKADVHRVKTVDIQVVARRVHFLVSSISHETGGDNSHFSEGSSQKRTIGERKRRKAVGEMENYLDILYFDEHQCIHRDLLPSGYEFACEGESSNENKDAFGKDALRSVPELRPLISTQSGVVPFRLLQTGSFPDSLPLYRCAFAGMYQHLLGSRQGCGLPDNVAETETVIGWMFPRELTISGQKTVPIYACVEAVVGGDRDLYYSSVEMPCKESNGSLMLGFVLRVN